MGDPVRRHGFGQRGIAIESSGGVRRNDSAVSRAEQVVGPDFGFALKMFGFLCAHFVKLEMFPGNREIRIFRSSEVQRFLQEQGEDYRREKLSDDEFSKFVDELEKFIDAEPLTTKTVLGFDIYKYSKLENPRQILIPHVFNMIYESAAKLAREKNRFLFQHEDDFGLKTKFISTGDGGFQIFDTPLHAVVFLCLFVMGLRMFNAGHLFPRTRRLMRNIDIRYCVTTAELYKFEFPDQQNYFGPAIINNARIMSKDKLNRVLIDEATFDWFMENIYGVEGLANLELDSLPGLDGLDNYDESLITDDFQENMFFQPHTPLITSADILKIGELEAKKDYNSVFNLHLMCRIGVELNQLHRVGRVSVGNLNTQGLV